MRILLLMLLPIGDTLFTTPSVRALRERYPNAHITALAYPTNSGILKSNPDIDEILLWPTRQNWPGIKAVVALFGRLRGGRFTMAVEFCNYIWWLTALCGIKKRSEMNLPRLWALRPQAGREWRKKHAVEHYADVVRRLGIYPHDMHLRIHPSPEEQRRAETWLEKYNLRPGEPLIGLHPGGEGLWGRKRWPIEHFVQVADGLSKIAGAHIMIMGGKDDNSLADYIAERTKAPIINSAGQTTLGETAALASMCALFIGNDSSPLHIAAASGTHVVGIYGPTDPRSYHPWVPEHTDTDPKYAVVRSHLSCACRFTLVGGITLFTWLTCLVCPSLKTISPEQVLDAAQKLMASAALRKDHSERHDFLAAEDISGQ